MPKYENIADAPFQVRKRYFQIKYAKYFMAVGRMYSRVCLTLTKSMGSDSIEIHFTSCRPNQQSIVSDPIDCVQNKKGRDLFNCFVLI